MPKKVLEPKSVWKSAPFKFSQAVLLPNPGKLLFLAGQTGMDPAGQVVKGGFVEQAREVFRNIVRILEESGGSFDDVVRLTVYLTDMKNLEPYTEILNEYAKGKNFPAQTVVEVKSLAFKEFMIEVEAFASIS